MGHTALITGASAGLGAEFARLFAADKHDLVLVARRRDRLESLAAELTSRHGIRVHVVPADLATQRGVSHILDELGRLHLDIDFLVNNAGFGTSGAFATAEAAREIEMVQVNVTALVTLTRALLPAMIVRKQGRILNIGSTAGFQPGPYMAVYYASKGFVNLFTEALAHELRGTGVTATVSCPGATATEFAELAGNDRSRLFRLGAASPATVAAEAYRAMMAGKSMVIHGVKNKLAVQLLRVSPRFMVRTLSASLNVAPQGKQRALPK